MFISRRKLLIARIVPLVIAGLAVIALIPSDFKAAANSFGQTATTSQPAAPLKISMPAPRLIVPAGPAPVAQPPAAIATKWQTQVALAPAQTVSSPLPSPETLRDDRVASQGANVRSAASKDALKLFTLAPDTSVRTAETVSGWVHIYADAGDGWVYSSLLASQAPADGATSAQASGGSSLVGQRVRLSSATRVYESPNGSPVYILDAGERVQVADSSGDWARIVTDTDESGWIRVR